MKRRVAEAGLRDDVRINRSGCLNQCGHGPVMVVYPDGVWYTGVQSADAADIMDQHILHDCPVERLRLTLPPGNNKRTDHYPAEVHSIKKVEKDLDRRREAARQSIRDELARQQTARQSSSPPNDLTGDAAQADAAQADDAAEA